MNEPKHSHGSRRLMITRQDFAVAIAAGIGVDFALHFIFALEAAFRRGDEVGVNDFHERLLIYLLTPVTYVLAAVLLPRGRAASGVGRMPRWLAISVTGSALLMLTVGSFLGVTQSISIELFVITTALTVYSSLLTGMARLVIKACEQGG